MKKPPYFKSVPGTPAPLRVQVKRSVRFEEVDPLNIVWHGRYASYFEDARVALGKKYGVGYQDFHRHGFIIPIKQMYLDYVAPLHFGEQCRIEACLHWSEAARINFGFSIHGKNDALVATGYTVQLILSTDSELQMVFPDFYADFCRQWQAGQL